MPSILVGCPVWRRGWVLPHYFEGVEGACEQVGLNPSYVFVSDPRDWETQEAISAYASVSQRAIFNLWVEESLDGDRRVWNSERYQRMVYLRNMMLEKVRELEPSVFLSLDSDIVLHPFALASMFEGLDKYDAVGAKCYMSPYGTEYPSFGCIDAQGNFYRAGDVHYMLQVDVIMAAKLMRPQAYDIDYAWHAKGEDIGWSLACRDSGLRLGFDGRVTNKHVMDRDSLNEVDARCGY